MTFYLKQRLSAKSTWLIAGLYILGFVALSLFFKPKVLVGLYSTYNIFFSDIPATFLLLPVYFIYLFFNYHFFGDIQILMRYRSMEKYWGERLIASLLETIVYFLFLYLLLSLQASALGQLSLLISKWSYLVACMFLQIITFFLLSEVFHLLSFLLENCIAAFFIAYLIAAYDYIAYYVLLIPKFMFFLSFWPHRDPDNFGNYAVVLLMEIIIATVLFFFIPALCEKKDLLPVRDDS